MADAPTVSVVMTVYNTERYVAEAVEHGDDVPAVAAAAHRDVYAAVAVDARGEQRVLVPQAVEQRARRAGTERIVRAAELDAPGPGDQAQQPCYERRHQRAEPADAASLFGHRRGPG